MYSLTDGKTKDVTLAELFDAIEKNGIPHVQNQMWDVGPAIKDKETGETVYLLRGGCAMAQGIMNLGVAEIFFNRLNDQLDGKILPWFHKLEMDGAVEADGLHNLSRVGDRIVYLNDSRNMSLPAIAAQLRKDYEPFLAEVIAGTPTARYRIDPDLETSPVAVA